MVYVYTGFGRRGERRRRKKRSDYRAHKRRPVKSNGASREINLIGGTADDPIKIAGVSQLEVRV